MRDDCPVMAIVRSQAEVDDGGLVKALRSERIL